MNIEHPGEIEIAGCHAEGEIGDVIVGGTEPPPGDTVWDQALWIARDERLRSYVLNEPRGGVFRHVNLLVPAKNPEADMGFIIMEPETRFVLDPRDPWPQGYRLSDTWPKMKPGR